jgi:hypothetical protein
VTLWTERLGMGAPARGRPLPAVVLGVPLLPDELRRTRRWVLAAGILALKHAGDG